MWRNRAATAAPDQECMARGHRFLLQIDRGTDGHCGAVFDENGVIRWRYGKREDPSGRSPGNPFNKPDFVIANPDGRGEVVIRRASFLPPVFNITDAGGTTGRISMRSPFRNKYTIDIDRVNSWTFRLPLYTIRFFGESSMGTEFWGAVGRTKMEWIVLFKRDDMEWPLLAALAFIHVEMWNYS